MSPKTKQIAELYEMLPEQEQQLAYEMVKRLVLAWDPDFTKVTPEERKRIQKAEKSGFIPADEIDWDHLEKYAD